MPELIPSILVKSAAEAKQKLAVVEGLVECVHLDVMDGHFVNNTTWSDAKEFVALESKVRVELHLMVSHPQSVMRDWASVPNCKRAIWHIEVPAFHAGLIQQGRSQNWEVGLAISPATPISNLLPYLDLIDEVLVMGVVPGFSGQVLIPATLDKVRELKRLKPTLKIGFDGGVTEALIPTLLEAGVERITLAHAVFGAPDPKEAIRNLQTKMEGK